jgi:hypothetical protein
MIDDHGGFESENKFYCQCEAGLKGGLCQERKNSAKTSDGQQANISTLDKTSSTSDTGNRTTAIILGVAGTVGLLALATWMIPRGSKRKGMEESDVPPAVVEEDCKDAPAVPGREDLDLPSIA